jgi:hypothetical protein
MRDLPVVPKQDSDPLGEVARRSPGRQYKFAIAIWRLFIEPAVALIHQLLELFILLIDAVGDPFLVLFTGSGGGLFDQLPDVVLKDRDPIAEFRQ